MNSLKTGLVVVVLLAVGYGAYTILNHAPGPRVPEGSVSWGPLQIDLGLNTDAASDGQGSLPTDAVAPLVQLPSAVDAQIRAPGSGHRPVPTDNALKSVPGDTIAKGRSDPSAQVMPYNLGKASEAVPIVDGTHSDLSPFSRADTTASTSPAVESPQGALTPDSSGQTSISSDAGNTPAWRLGFNNAWRTAQAQIQEGQLPDALFTLSIWYESPDLPVDEHRRLVDLLDQLAGAVIYSRKHTMEQAYVVRAHETLRDIAEQYSVPWQMLAKINGVRDPDVLVPGQELKVLRGPFRAEIDLARQELTLFMGRNYAGRFPISLGHNPPPRTGIYEVIDKTQGTQGYTEPGGRVIPAADPANPYGMHWLGLSGGLSIHGSPSTSGAVGSGCVSLSPRDTADVFAILSRNSRVVIKGQSDASRVGWSHPPSKIQRVSFYVPGML